MNFFQRNYMKNEDLKKELLRIKYEYGVTQAAIAGMVNVAPTYLSDMLNGRVEYNETFKKKLLSTFPNIVHAEETPSTPVHDRRVKLIPLLPFSAAAGYLAGGNGVDAFREEAVAFSDFTDRGADCAIRVDGDSMYPRYKSGDVLAIKIIKDPKFFQWGRTYCISTTQGCIIKKLFPDPSDENKIICHSENTSAYPDYKITMDDVLAVAIVVGHAGVE